MALKVQTAPRMVLKNYFKLRSLMMLIDLKEFIVMISRITLILEKVKRLRKESENSMACDEI